MASIKDCALSLLAAHDLRRGNLISDDDHDRIVGRVRRDINKNNGVAGLIAEGQHKRMANGIAPNLYPAGHYVNTQPADNNPYGMHDEENLNWHGLAGLKRCTRWALIRQRRLAAMRVPRLIRWDPCESASPICAASRAKRMVVMPAMRVAVLSWSTKLTGSIRPMLRLGGCLRMRRVFLTRRFNACGMR